jgi:hypothetical protein
MGGFVECFMGGPEMSSKDSRCCPRAGEGEGVTWTVHTQGDLFKQE